MRVSKRRSRRQGGGRPPSRRLNVMFLGAGASKGADLPLTEELLERVWPRSGRSIWNSVKSQSAWDRELAHATKVLYPQSGSPGFRPQVADFFTVLEVVAQVLEGRERLGVPAGSILRDLRKEIAIGLDRDAFAVAARWKDAEPDDRRWPHATWLAPTNGVQVVVTSNWDGLAEIAGRLQSRVVYLRWPRDRNGQRVTSLRSDAVVVLKLHGSTDWGTRADAAMSITAANYSQLSVPIGQEEIRAPGRPAASTVLRHHSVERNGSGGVGFNSPLMATMAMGKTSAIESLDGVWSDAYWCLSRAAQLAVTGYSFPTDDLEIRTLLRASTRQAGGSDLDPGVDLTVVNPSPEAHDRARSFLGDGIGSDYFGAH